MNKCQQPSHNAWVLSAKCNAAGICWSHRLAAPPDAGIEAKGKKPQVHKCQESSHNAMVFLTNGNAGGACCSHRDANYHLSLLYCKLEGQPRWITVQTHKHSGSDTNILSCRAVGARNVVQITNLDDPLRGTVQDHTDMYRRIVRMASTA